MKYVDYSGLYRILANLKAWIKSVFVSNVTVSGRTISVTKNDQTTSTDLSYPAASDSAAGVTKLYAGLGSNQDGAMTQKRITELINAGYIFMGIASPGIPLPLEELTAPDGTIQKKFWLAVQEGTYSHNALIQGQTETIGTIAAGELGVITMQLVGGNVNVTYTMTKGLLSIPSASSSVAGIMKLYETVSGQNSDGTVTQGAIAEAIGRVVGLAGVGYQFEGVLSGPADMDSMVVYDEGQKVFFIASTPGNYDGAFTIDPGEICAICVNGKVDPQSQEQYNSYWKVVLFTLASSTGQGTNVAMSQKAVTDALNLKFDKSNIITSAEPGVTGDNAKVASDKELNARLAQIRAEMAQIGGFSTAYSTLAALEAAAEDGQLDARKIYLIPLSKEGPTDVYSEYILITAQGQLYKCDECGYVYNPDKGDPDRGVPPGTPFTNLPSDWVCPSCENTKDNFTAIAGYVERIGSTSLDMDAITNAEIDQAFVDNGMVPAS